MARGRCDAGDQAAAKAADVPAERKIIYTATLELIVKDLDDVLPAVRTLLVAGPNGYVKVAGDTGTRRTARPLATRPGQKPSPRAREGLPALGTRSGTRSTRRT